MYAVAGVISPAGARLAKNMSIRVAIFDGNENIRDNIVHLIEKDPHIEVVGIFSDVDRCVKDVLSCKPDIVLMDIEMPGDNGIAAIRKLKQEVPSVQILIQTSFEDDDRIYLAIIAGACGYLLKSQLCRSLLSAIRELQSGGAPMSPPVARRVLSLLRRPRFPGLPVEEHELTPREKQVLACIVRGLSYKMICSELKISYETVRTHMKNIYGKLHVASLTEVVAKAIYQNIV